MYKCNSLSAVVALVFRILKLSSSLKYTYHHFISGCCFDHNKNKQTIKVSKHQSCHSTIQSPCRSSTPHSSPSGMMPSIMIIIIPIITKHPLHCSSLATLISTTIAVSRDLQSLGGDTWDLRQPHHHRHTIAKRLRSLEGQEEVRPAAAWSPAPCRRARVHRPGKWNGNGTACVVTPWRNSLLEPSQGALSRKQIVIST
ncbi:hypothetical protein GWI33_002758 [Rhynchophorus ferrugineus]|uniref:Uncharacterized protein n=1 Tax=Rhynchophorus ferrugineus TaxID=354439 RepID=A0A834INZ5_RHYFE|nr:hypothetical protein GWI33_002758 [Rhynchophorus ferrugineus]